MTGLAVPFDDKDVHGCQSPSPGSIYIEEKSIETPTAARDLFDFHGDNSSQEARHYGADNQQIGQEFPSRKPESNKHNQHHASTKDFSSFCSTHVQNNPTSFQYQAPLATASAVDIPMSWVGGNTSAPHPGEKPKRPLSAYNFFFQLERERIINGEYEDNDDIGIYTIEDVAKVALVQQRKAKENKPKEKRSHRKTHGKISFGDLARTIANKWKKLDEKSKQMFEGSAAIEKERYKKELAEWTKNHKKWKEATIKMTLSQHGVCSPTGMPYSIVTPPQIPKKTVVYKEVPGKPSDELTKMYSTPFDAVPHVKVTNDQGGLSVMGEDEQLASLVAQQNHIMRMMTQGKQVDIDHERRLSNRMISAPRKLSNHPSLSRNLYGQGDTSYSQNGQSRSSTYDYDTMTDETFSMAQLSLPQQRSKLSQLDQMGIHQQQRDLQQQLQLKALMQQNINSQNSGMLFHQSGRGHQNSMNTLSLDIDTPFVNDTMRYGMSQLVPVFEKNANTTFGSHDKSFMLSTSGQQDVTQGRWIRYEDKDKEEDGDDYQPLNHRAFMTDELNNIHMLHAGFGDECLNERT